MGGKDRAEAWVDPDAGLEFGHDAVDILGRDREARRDARGARVAPLYHREPPSYNPAHEAQPRDHHSNYLPGVLIPQTPGPRRLTFRAAP